MLGEPGHVYRRRRVTAAAIAIAAAIGGVLIVRGLGGEDDQAPPPPDPLADVSVGQLVGQRLMVRMGDEATAELLDAARQGRIGGVILFPPPGVEPDAMAAEVERLQGAAEKGGNPPLLVAIDQEGGEVKRLPAGPPNQAPPELGEAGAAAATAAGADTAEYLERFGVNVDLAPVLDVPAPGSFVAGRAFGDDPGTVAEVGVAFAQGLQQGGVAATAKHFPGLGLASVNTDVSPSLVEAPRSELRAGFEPFEAAVAAEIDLVMTSNATYTALDPGAPASLSRRVVEGELRERLGFGGVVISDDLEAGAITALHGPEDAALDAARADVDVLLFASGADPEPIAQALAKAADRGRLDRAALEASYDRITALKERVAAD